MLMPLGTPPPPGHTEDIDDIHLDYQQQSLLEMIELSPSLEPEGMEVEKNQRTEMLNSRKLVGESALAIMKDYRKGNYEWWKHREDERDH
jgi:hypothetical protein